MQSHSLTRRDVLRSAAAVATVAALGPIGCSSSKTEVVLYTSVDEPIASKVVAAFHAAHPKTQVRLVVDTEASKSVGLAVRLRAEQARPICHVWWGNEVFHTIGLAQEGFFSPLPSDAVVDIEPAFRDPQGRWAGNGLRARVMAVADGVEGVTGKLDDLLDPRFRGRVAIARPLTGTTGGHVAALYELWGEERADVFFRKLKENGCLMLGGNSDVADQIGRGTIQVGLTDNDDCASSIANGGKLKLVPLEQQPGGIGTLAIPTTVALIKRPDSPTAALELVRFLLSAENEARLADAQFTAYSVRAGTPTSVREMNVRYDAVAARMQTAPRRVVDILDGRA